MILFLEMQAEVKPYADEAYGYICTCLIDANGIKNMLGADEESSQMFSSCSESAAKESYEGE